MKFIIKVVTVISVLALPLFANAVAAVTAIKGSVKIHNTSVDKLATLGEKLEEKDSVITADNSKAQLMFNDDTIITVGKNSNFSISEYMYEDSKEPTAQFNLVKGAMRTITGKIGKIAPERFSVRANTATIGIRGTNFTVTVLENGSTRAYCTYGAISVTIGSGTEIVDHGFYLEISPSGEITKKEFSAQELKDMRENNFGAQKPLEGEASEDGTYYGNGIVIDDVTDDVSQGTNLKLDDSTQDSAQATTTTPDSTPDPTPTPTPTYISMSGFNINDNAYTDINENLSLKFTEDGSSFDQTNSWIKVLKMANHSGMGEDDNWKFTLAETPTSFTSRDDFETTFSSVTLTPIESSTSTNAQLTASSFKATADLSSSDLMSWGTWSASVEFTSTQSGTQTGDSHDFVGLWVSGEPTDASVVNAMTGTQFYTGQYKVHQINDTTPTFETGNANLSVDFGADTAILYIYANNGLVGANYEFNNMTLSGNSMSGGTLTSGGSHAHGTFVNQNATSAIGDFQIRDAGNGTDVQGVYQVSESAGW